MAFTDEEIASIMTKEIACKTILVSKKDAKKLIKKHNEEGWIVTKQSEINDKLKITFKK